MPLRHWPLVLPLLLGWSSLSQAQAVQTTPPEDAAGPAVRHHGLTPGVSTVKELRAARGEPAHQGKWYAWKLLYPSSREGLFDAFHLLGSPEDGKIGTIEAASIPEGFTTRALVLERLGDPELSLRYPGGQGLLDYSERGVRFTFDEEGRTIGAAFFPHGYPRVHSGAPGVVDLYSLRQGPQPPPASPAPPGLRAGAAEVTIDPSPEHVRGEFRIVDSLKARCAVLERDELRIAIVGADLFGMLKSEVDPIEARLREKGIDHLLLAMSHDHSAPDTIGIYGSYPADYVATIQDRVVEGVLAAAARLEEVEQLVVASDDLSLAGARVHGLFRNARNPGLVDPQLAAIQARGAEGRPIVTFVHFACHVEGVEAGAKEITADFPGYLCDRLRETTGAQAIFLNGALGGMVSGDTRERSHEEARLAGLRIAAEVERLLGFATPCETSALSFRRKRIEAPVTNTRFLLFEKLYRSRRPYYRGRVVSEMFHLRIGDAEIVTVPGELLPELGFEVIAEMRGFPRMVVGLANDELGYLIPAYDFRAGEYEESMSIGPVMGPLVTETARRLIEESRNPND